MTEIGGADTEKEDEGKSGAPSDNGQGASLPEEKRPRKEPEQKGRVTVALDAMGGDHGPPVVISGAITALNKIPGLSIALVGDEEVINKELAARSFSSPNLTVRHASEAIGMDESPSVALRKKKDSSIHVGVKLVKAKEADAFVSAGHTGAVMAVAAVVLRTLEGIDRAAIAVPLPHPDGHTVLLDAGANVICKASNLYQFGVMGSNYARYVLGHESPKVGLLSIGEEETKGTDTQKEAFELLTSCPTINFIGNVEGKLLYKGAADVVVCDGFTGNIALKVSESVAGMITGFLKEIFLGSLKGKIAGLLIKPALAGLKKRIDHREVGGAPLLGVGGAVFIAHGSSDEKSIESALKAAKRFIDEDVNGHIKESLAAYQAGPDEKEDSGFWERVKSRIGMTGAQPVKEEE